MCNCMKFQLPTAVWRVLLLCTVGQELSLNCWWTAWDMCDPWCAWSHWAHVLHTLIKLSLFLSAIHCGVERHNLWVGSHSRTMHNGNNWLWQYKTPNADEFKLFEVQANILLTARAQCWWKSDILCSWSARGCGHPSQPTHWQQELFGPVLVHLSWEACVWSASCRSGWVAPK